MTGLPGGNRARKRGACLKHPEASEEKSVGYEKCLKLLFFTTKIQGFNSGAPYKRFLIRDFHDFGHFLAII